MDLGFSLGSGGVAYPTAAALQISLTNDLVLTAAAHGGRALEIYASKPGLRITLYSGVGLADIVKQVGFISRYDSFPVAIFNGGVIGTDPVFEGMLLPGAHGKLEAGDTTITGGWIWFGNNQFVKAIYPAGGFTVGPTTLDIGAATLGTNTDGTQNRIAMCTPTFFAWVYADNANDIKLIAGKIQADSTINWSAAGVPTTMASHVSDVYQSPGVFRLGAAKVAIGFKDNTNTLNKLVAVDLTDSGTPSVGSPGAIISMSGAQHSAIAPASMGFCKNGGDASSSTRFWLSGSTAANVNVLYLVSCTGTALTLEATQVIDAASGATTFHDILSPADDVCYAVGLSPIGTSYLMIKKYTQSGGSISTAWTCEFPVSGTYTSASVLGVDTTNNSIWLSTGTSTIMRVNINLTTGALRSVQEATAVTEGTAHAISTQNNWFTFPDGARPEALLISTNRVFPLALLPMINGPLQAAATVTPSSGRLQSALFPLPNPQNFMGGGRHIAARRLIHVARRQNTNGGNQIIQFMPYEVPRTLAVPNIY